MNDDQRRWREEQIERAAGQAESKALPTDAPPRRREALELLEQRSQLQQPQARNAAMLHPFCRSCRMIRLWFYQLNITRLISRIQYSSQP